MKNYSSIEILPARKRGVFLKINGKPVISEFDPILEGERFATVHKNNKNPILIIFLGILPLYHIECILSGFRHNLLVWIFEADSLMEEVLQRIIKNYSQFFPIMCSQIQKKKYSLMT